MDSTTVSLLTLRNTERNNLSRIAVVSLPVPSAGRLPRGLAGIATQSQDIAWWPDSQSGRARAPRRRLLFGLTEQTLPAECRLGKAVSPSRNFPGVGAKIRIVDENLTRLLPYKVGEVEFRSRNRSLALRMGIRWKNEYHWWQWLRLEELWAGPLVKAVRIGGFIEVEQAKLSEFRRKENQLGGRWLHFHNWLFAEIFALCFANGVVQIAARHINNHRFDEGRELHSLVPVLGLVPDKPTRLHRALDGTQTRFSIGSASLNLADAAPLVSPEHPGSLRTEDGVIVYQPYEGVEVEGGMYRGGRKDGYRVRAHERRMPKGLARTVRFHFSLGDVSPEVTRLVVPEWWYAMCGDLWPGSALPVHDAWNRRIVQTYDTYAVDTPGGFDEAVMGRHWESEAPYAQFRYFYRSGNLQHWRHAIRDVYHVADIAFDHSTETMRSAVFPFDGSISPAWSRTVGLTFGHLETGDPYLLECAEAATNHWYWIDRKNWPRFAYGRDGSSLRSLIFLWDYTGEEHYRKMAREAIGRLIQCQNPDGSYFDQGGTVGVHAIGQVTIKQWMANLATDPVLDYLLRGHDDPELWRAVERTGEFIRRCFQRGKDADYWPYQMSYGGTNYDPWFALRDPRTGGKLPTARFFSHGHKARLLQVLTRRSGEAKYYEMWLRHYQRHWANVDPPKGDFNMCVKTLQHLPYAQAHFWNARWHKGSVEIDPLDLPHHREWSGTVITPAGNVTLKIRRDANRWSIVEQHGAEVRVTFTARPTTSHRRARHSQS